MRIVILTEAQPLALSGVQGAANHLFLAKKVVFSHFLLDCPPFGIDNLYLYSG